MEIYPSLMCADLLNLGKVISDLEAHCDGFHVDVMDDHFVPNLTMGPDFVNAIIKATRKPVQVHLMVDNPAAWPDRLKLGKKDTFIFHYEAYECFEPIKKLIKMVKSTGCKVGMALNPESESNLIKAELLSLDKLLIMAVKPGFAGQKFIPKALDKVKIAANFRKKQNGKFKIYVDGGIDKGNIKQLGELGVDAVAVGSSIFSEKNPVKALKDLYEIVNRS